MSGAALRALLPLLLLAAGSLVVMLAGAFTPGHRRVAGLTAATLVLALATLAVAAPVVPIAVTPLIWVDRYSLLFTGLMLAAALFVTALAYGYLEAAPPGLPAQRHGNFHLLVLLGTLGACVLTAAAHFASFFLGFEILTVSLFALVAYRPAARHSLEAAAKYLMLAGVSSAFLLFGMALIYAQLGALDFATLAHLSQRAAAGPYLLVGIAFTAVGLGFKLSLVPFHMWTPDVYQGAPAPVGAFIATISKGAVAALLLRYLVDTGANALEPVRLLLAIIAFASMLAGNLLALLQQSIKRLLGYSSIAHLGFLLVPVVAGGPFAAEAVGYYLTAYFITLLGAFGVLTVLSTARAQELDRIEDLRGLHAREPLLAALFTLMLLSLAGIPVTVGFIAKFYVLAAGLEAALGWLVAAVIAGSAIGIFYYLRVVAVIYTGAAGAAAPAVGWRAGHLTLALLGLLLLLFGLYPQPLAGLLTAPPATGVAGAVGLP